MRNIFTLIISFLFIFQLNAQKLESSQLLDSYSAAEITAIIGLSVNHAVDLYKIRYHTADLNGNDHIASGLLCVPKGENLIFPLACYQHGTIFGGREDVPSNLQGGFELAMIFASFGYAVCVPDMLGLGESPGIHPYVHADTEASAAVDMLYAAREFDDQTGNFDLNEQLYITGYSQGGHAAMATHRDLETNYSNDFQVTASAPMSGPYSVSEKMIDFTLSDNEYATVSYLAWVFLSYKAAYPMLLEDFEVEDFFLEPFASDIREFESEDINLQVLNDRISENLIQSVGGVIPKFMLKPGVEELIKTDSLHPFSIALQRNDTYDWTPNAPTRLYYCQGDDQVTFENSILAESVMQANGAADVQALQRDGFAGLSDHGECVFPASYSAILFFRDFQEILSSNENLVFDPNISVNYNQEFVHISLPSGKNPGDYKMALSAMNGQRIKNEFLYSNLSYHELSTLSSGMYILTIWEKDKMVKSKKIVKF